MSGDDIFVAIVFYLANGDIEARVEAKDVQKNWSKSIFRRAYNRVYAARAKGRIHPLSRGIICLTEEGISYIQDLMGEVPTFATTLIVFSKGNAHSFDRFLRSILKKATQSIEIADTYVSGGLFDTLLNEISKTVPICFLYDKDVDGFVARAVRFEKEYIFQKKQSSRFHDRFLIIDGKGYIIGPSLKDAADKKPATLVALNSIDSEKLVILFLYLWSGK